MNADRYRDMHLLDEVTQTPDTTQRDLAKRIGVALGLTNLMLRRLAKKGYIKIVNAQKSRLRYLITPKGVMEKAQLTREYVQYSLFFYRSVREFLHAHLRQLQQQGHRRILLWGTDELSEIAFLTIQEVGLELVGVIDDPRDRERFLGMSVRTLSEVAIDEYDRILVASLRWHNDATQRLTASGVSADRIIIVPHAGNTRTSPVFQRPGTPVAMTLDQENHVTPELIPQ